MTITESADTITFDATEAQTLDNVADLGATTDQALTTGGIIVGDGNTVGATTTKWLFDDTNNDVTTTGNVGIGTTNPLALLDLGGANGATPTNTKLWIKGAGSGSNPAVIQSRISLGVDNNVDYGAFIGAVNIDGSGSGMALALGDRGAGIDHVAMYLRTGNVGIGTTAPNQKLTIEGTLSLKEKASANADTAAYGQLWVKTATPNELWFTDDGGTDTQLGAGGAGDLKADGSVPLTADWDVGAYDITAVEFKGALKGNADTVTNGVYTSDFPLNQDTTGKADTAGNADTVTNATFTTALTVNTGTLTLTAHADNDSVLTIGKGAVGVTGTNTGDNTVCTSGTATSAGTVTGLTLNSETLTLNTGALTLTPNADDSSVLTIGAGAVSVDGSNTGDQDLSGKADVDQTMYIGTTGVAINRTTAALTLAGLTLTTPDIGTPSAGTLTNCTFPTLNQNTTGKADTAGNADTVTNGVYTTDFPLNQSTTGSAATLTTPRAINGVDFNGSAPITVTAAAGTLTGATLKSDVLASSLTSLGTIASLVATTADINAGTFDGIVGGTTPADGSFSTLSATGKVTATDNVTIGGTTGAGTSGEGVLVIENNRAPTTSPANVVQLYAEDIGVEATGGTVTRSGGKTIHTFTSSGTFTVPANGPTEVTYLVVAGGGGGSYYGGGGGAGGYRTGTAFAVTPQGYSITVGTGGAGKAADSVGNAGLVSTFDTISATGGGGGGCSPANGAAGGSGGGGGSTSTNWVGGAGNSGSYDPVEGYAGGANYRFSSYGAGGGGGSSEVGHAAPDANYGGAGGDGTSNSITGGAVIYAAGGGGSIRSGGTAGGAGGSSGVGGAGGNNAVGGNATANTGSGGGGGGSTNAGGSGSDGIVIISYTTPAPTSELVVRDEAGNVTTLSPHNFKNIPNNKIKKLETDSDGMAWTYHSEKDNKSITVDMFSAIQLLEKVSGEKLIYTNDEADIKNNVNVLSLKELKKEIK